MRRSPLIRCSKDPEAGIRLVDIAPCLLANSWAQQLGLKHASQLSSHRSAQALSKLSVDSLRWSGASHICVPSWLQVPTGEGPSSFIQHVGGGTLTLHDKRRAVNVMIDYPLTAVGADSFYGCSDLARVQSCQDELVHTLLSEPGDGIGHGGPSVEITAWLRSALGCRYEGPDVQAIRVADEVSRLLSLGCHRVILEEAMVGLTPRWLEITLKTIHAVGGSAEQVGLSIAENGSLSSALIHCALAHGVSTFVGSSFVPVLEKRHNSAQGAVHHITSSLPGTLPAYPMFEQPAKRIGNTMGDARLSMAALVEVALAYQERSSGVTLDDNEVNTLSLSREFCDSVSKNLRLSVHDAT